MALTILQGERPVFYWGQPYLGAIEMYLTGGIFWLAGVSALTIKIIPVATSILFIATLYQVGRSYFNSEVGLLSAAVAAAAPLLVIRGVKATGYGPVLVLGNLALLQVAQFHRLRPTAPSRQIGARVGILGVTCGLLFFAHPMALAYVVPIVIWLAQYELALALTRHVPLSKVLRFGTAGILIFAVGSAIGMAPLLWENANTGWQTFTLLGGAGSDAPDWPARFLEFRTTFPILLGFLQPTSQGSAFWEQVASNRMSFWAGLLLGAGLTVCAAIALARVGRRYWRTREVQISWLLLYTCAATVVFSVGSRFSSFTEPRYMLPVYSCVPFFFGTVGRARLRNLVITGSELRLVLASGLIGIGLLTLSTLNRDLNLPYLEGRPYPRDLSPVLARLTEERVEGVYSDYWICYRLMLEARGAIDCAVVDGLGIGFNRRWQYAAAVNSLGDPAWLFVASSEADTEFGNEMDRRQIGHVRSEIGGYSLYSGLSTRVQPGRFKQLSN